VFLDAGNVWDFTDEFVPDGGFPTTLKDFVKQTALGTGIGLRYDMGFLVIRLDWGLALHYPYETDKSGYFNVPSFKGAHTLHFAVGYPF
jgi:outer membrane protein assembly factor BamA